MQREKTLYLASADDILNTVALQDNGFNSILLVAHNPGLTDLANRFKLGVTDNLPTAGLVSAEFDEDEWSELDTSTARLTVYDFPKRMDD